MRLVIIFFALIMVVTYVSGSIDNARCSIEGIEDVKGVCLDNRHCEIWENLKKNLTITEIRKFKKCDSEDEEMICCLNKKDVEKVLNIFSNSIRSENAVRSVENIEETSSKDIKGNDETCLTKEKGIEGICVSLESCDYLFYKSQINPNSYDLIEARVEKCQRIVGKPYCCGIIENVNFRRNSLSTDPPQMTTEFSSSQYDNDTPCGRSGTCKLYKDCPYLKNRIKGIENNDDERNFLNENFCHYFQGKPYYCCDIQENERTTTKASYINISTTRNDLILDGTTTLRIVANEPEFDSCGENALCKPLQECDYLKYVKEDMQFQGKLDFFDNRRCSTSSGNIHLCCSIDERKQMNTKVLPNVIPQYEIIQAIPYSFCKDPNGANGFCAADCPSLNQTLRSIKSKSAQNDNFRERFCGYSRLAKPHYCCVPSPNRQIKISKNAEIVSPDHCTINDLKGYCIGLKHSGYLLNYYTESKLNQDSNRRKMIIFLAKIKCEPSVRHQIYANYVCSLHSKTDQNHFIQIIDKILNLDASCQTDERTGICKSLENCDYAKRSYDKLSNEKARNDLLEYKKCSPREWQSQSTNDHYVCCISSESENDLIKKFPETF